MSRNLSFIVGVFFLFLLSCNTQDKAIDAILLEPPYKELSDSIKQFPNRDDLYFQRAILLNKNNHSDFAKKDFLKAWELKNEEEYALGASTIMLNDQPREALIFLTNILDKKNVNNDLLQLIRARAYVALGAKDSALMITNQLVKKEPILPDVLLYEADLYGQKGDTASMVHDLEKLYTSMPASPYVALKLAYMYAELKSPKAIEISEALITGDSLKTKAEPYYVMGIYYSNIKKYSDAIGMYDKVIALDYYYLNAYIEKIKAYLEMGDIKNAQSTVTLLIKLSPSFPDGWYWQGMIQLKKGLKDEAKQSFTKAYVLDKTFIKAKEQAEQIK